MKTIILLCFLSVSVLSQTQIFYPTKTIRFAISEPLYKKDTIKVLMLVSDTARVKTYEFYNCDGTLYGYSMTDESDLPKGGYKKFTGFLRGSNNIYHMYGYSAGELHNEAEGFTDWGMDHQRVPNDYHVHKTYLDSRKKPLKNKLVWLSIEVAK